MLYDVIIIGGGTSGCAAAYTAGKLGLKTLIIEKNIHLGGAITSGLVIPVMYSGQNQINTEFYDDLILELKNIGGQITYQNNSGWFNPELTKIALDKLMQKAGVDVLFNASVKMINYKDKIIESIELDQPILSPCIDTIRTNNISSLDHNLLSVCIGAKWFIDATGNCEFSKNLNCEILNDCSEYQPMSLRFIMSGVDKKRFANWIIDYDSDRNVTTVEEIDGDVHFSTAYTWDTNKHWALAPLFDDAVNKNILKDSDRNYFQLFTVAGMPESVAFNCPRIIQNLDPNCVKDISLAAIEARESILRLSNFCRQYLPGFEKAFISNIADELGIRVSHRIRGKYVYTIDDLKTGKKFENPALISNYPIDIHNNNKNASCCEKTGEYQLPLESLMSYNYDNLFVIGRCLSADYKSQGALRVQASCFSMGEAVAKYISNSA